MSTRVTILICLHQNPSQCSLGEKVKQMLIASGGDFSQFEIRVKKTMSNVQENEIQGQYVTEIFLEKEGWDPDMIENSRQWAIQRGLHRTSPIHGKEEWKLPMKENFSFKNTEKEEVSAAASSTGEEGSVAITVHGFFPSWFSPPPCPGPA